MRPVDTYEARTPLVVELDEDDFRTRMHEALSIYVAAMNYPVGTEYHRAPMWTEHLRRPGWQAVGAFAAGPGHTRTTPSSGAPLVAVAYGYRGSPDQWWYQQVKSGMQRSGWDEATIDATLGSYFELTELHVAPAAQGHRTGERLLRKLLAERPERGVLLSTPEVADEDNRAWRLYRRLGFSDVLRHYHFAGDRRSFAVLGRGLPFAESGPSS
ncbi:GNAT family N-acetyltransferase [Rhodococcus sp. NPDC058521]|uniref:GNAT family N-acetyltransferase n=1 Tax=Rhodococcus sp. NPDC058521 TaxID=3346536 RepID=UPI00364A3CB4